MQRGLRIPGELRDVTLNTTVQLLVCDANTGAFELAKEIQGLSQDKVLLETLYTTKRLRRCARSLRISLKRNTDLKFSASIVDSFPMGE